MASLAAWYGMNRPGAASTHRPELCFTRSWERNCRIQTVRGFQRIDGRKPRRDAQIQRRIAQRQIQIDQQRFLLRFLGQRHRKIAGQHGRSGAALGAHERKQLSCRLLRGPHTGRRAAARTSASATTPCANGRVRNSRAPARMQRTSSSGSALSEYTITVANPSAPTLSTSFERELRIAVQIDDDDVVTAGPSTATHRRVSPDSSRTRQTSYAHAAGSAPGPPHRGDVYRG